MEGENHIIGELLNDGISQRMEPISRVARALRSGLKSIPHGDGESQESNDAHNLMIVLVNNLITTYEISRDDVTDFARSWKKD